jgi:hypothetical protein
MLLYPYTNLAHSRHRDYEERARTHRFITHVTRSAARRPR